MPEGPEIRKAADRIERVLVNQPMAEVFFAFDALKPYEAELAGQQVTAVQTYGKAMITCFEQGLAIYSHNQLYGVWRVVRAYNYPDTNRQLRLALHTEKKSALLYSASDIQVLPQTEVAHHPFIARLGPDVMHLAVTVGQLRERVGDRTFARRRLATLLLDQHFICGIGNYLRSEALFVARIAPTARPVDCSAEQLDRLAAALLDLPRQSYAHGGVTNDLAIAQQLKAQGLPRRAYRHWVFSRANQPCYICQTPIHKIELSGRRLYYCPHCQRHPAQP